MLIAFVSITNNNTNDIFVVAAKMKKKKKSIEIASFLSSSHLSLFGSISLIVLTFARLN